MNTPYDLSFFSQLIVLLPSFCQGIEKSKSTDFTRNSKPPLPRLIIKLLDLVAGGASRGGVDIKLGDFFNLSRRDCLWPDAEAPDRSAVTKARSKLGWGSFAALLRQAVELAYQVFPEREEYTWYGMSVFAFDGSKYTLPAPANIHETFDPDSGLDKPDKGHYPQALVNTEYDVFRRMPVSRTVFSTHDGDERKQALKLLGLLSMGCVCLFGRGYPGYGFIHALLQQPR